MNMILYIQNGPFQSFHTILQHYNTVYSKIIIALLLLLCLQLFKCKYAMYSC